MKFGYVIIYVEDVPFSFERGMVYEEEGVVDYAELKTGETTIGFGSLDLAKMNLGEKY